LPTSSLDAALRTLKLQLSIQRNEVTDFLQQFEDNAQSRAWLEEAADLGFDINLPGTRPQNREESGISL
jgi:CBS-domain-containing membrane protein